MIARLSLSPAEINGRLMLKKSGFSADNMCMKISTGMAEIFLGRNPRAGAVGGKTYIWPDYRQNAVEKIRGREPDQNGYIYRKPDPATRDELIGSMFRSEQKYDASGRAAAQKAAVAPGSFFDAFA